MAAENEKKENAAPAKEESKFAAAFKKLQARVEALEAQDAIWKEKFKNY
jgi:lipase chaperone LimK